MLRIRAKHLMDSEHKIFQKILEFKKNTWFLHHVSKKSLSKKEYKYNQLHEEVQ